MANVLKVFPDPRKQTQTIQTLDTSNLTVKYQILQYWKVVFDGAVSDPTRCLGASDGTYTIPVPLQEFQSAVGALPIVCNRVQPMLDPNSAGKVYEVQVEYATLDAQQPTADPWKVEITIDGVETTETLYMDINGNPLVNTVTNPFDPAPTKTYYDEQINVKFKSTIIDVASVEGCRGKLNQSGFSMNVLNYSRYFEPKSVKLAAASVQTVIGPTPTSNTPTNYWDVSYTMIYRRPQQDHTINGPGGQISGWALQIANQGAMAVDPVTGTVQPIVLGPLIANEKLFLDRAGMVTATPTYLYFEVEDSTDFSPLFVGINQ